MLANIYSRNKATQNQVWAGMAKETAHQLGTPLSSLNGWMEVLKNSNVDATVVTEMQRDVERLDLVSDRFGKIGSKPQLSLTNISQQVGKMVDYMRKRASGKIHIEMVSEPDNIHANISPQLFDWVIENLIKNALDAMDGIGKIDVRLTQYNYQIIIEVQDSGKGIAKKNWNTIFKPGYTTKKRGWGLGLSLTKRIIEEYHGGKIFVKESEINRGTTFRIELMR
jgi:signal transduction histidine kinase